MSNYTRSKIYYSETAADGAQTGVSQVTDTTEQNFQPLEAYAHIATEENVAIGAVVSIGTNEPDYNNIVSAKSIGGLLGFVPLQVQLNLPLIEPETDIKVKVNQACVPNLFTTPTLEFTVIVSGMDL